MTKASLLTNRITDAVAICMRREHLRRTVRIALVVGVSNLGLLAGKRAERKANARAPTARA